MAALVEIEIVGLEAAIAAVNALGSPQLVADGFAGIGGLVESQTRNRFSERRAPDGTPWAPWSAAYAASRHKGQSLLVASGALRDSIAWELDGGELRIGSNLVYAAIHQLGGTPDMAPGPAAIPAREYLGVSGENATEIEQALADWIGAVLQ